MSRRHIWLPVLLTLGLTLNAFAARAAITSVLPAERKLLYVAVTDGVTIDRQQINLTYNLGFEISGPVLAASMVLPNIGPALFSVTPNGNHVTLTLDSAPASAYSGLLSGTLFLNFNHDGDPGSVELDVEFRALDVGHAVVFEGYTTTSSETSDITPMALNGAPPFGATSYVWNVLGSSGLGGADVALANHLNGGQQKLRWLNVWGGTDWTDVNGTATIEINKSGGSLVHMPSITLDVLLRSFSDLTIFEQQVFYPHEGPISAIGLSPGDYNLLPIVDDSSNIVLDPNLGSVVSASPVGGWAYGTEMDVEITDGAFCPTLTVRDVDLRFRSLLSDGYTLFQGHTRGQEVIDLSLIHDTYTLLIYPGSTQFPIISSGSGTTPDLSFDANSTCTSIITPPPLGYWGTDDSFNLLIEDGDRPRSMIPRNVSFRAFPAKLSYFDQQLSADPATIASTAGGFDIQAVDSSWLVSPFGTPPDYLAGAQPRPVFTASGALLSYEDGGVSPATHDNSLLITDGDRPWSAGTGIKFELRHIADDMGAMITPGNPLQIPGNGSFEVQVIDGDKAWSWSGAQLIGFDTGSVSVSGGESATGFFTANSVTGLGNLKFNLGPSQTNPDHPWIHIGLNAGGGVSGTERVVPDFLPKKFALYSGYPNPFNPSTTIRYDLPKPSAVELAIYNIAGHRVRTLISVEQVAAGRHDVTWYGRNDQGRILAAGVYFYRLETDGFKSTKRFTLVK